MTLTNTIDAATLIDRAPELGSPPIVYSRLMEVMADPRASAADVAEVISMDAALTVRMLKQVNSAAFARRRRVENVSQAVGVLGTRRVRELAAATSVTTYFKNVPPELVHASDFWHHSVAVGVGARVIAAKRGEMNAERFFVAGLLHDIGRLVLYLGAPDHARAVLRHAEEHGVMMFEAEQSLLGFDHAEVGGLLMQRWNMPDVLAEAITHHHRPADTTAFALEAATVHLADALAHELGLGRSGEGRVPFRLAEAVKRLGLPEDVLDGLPESVEKEFNDSIEVFGLTE